MPDPDANIPLPPPPPSNSSRTFERPVGVGEMPSTMRQFSWGAYLLGPLWGAANGIIPVIYYWLAGIAVPVFIVAMVPKGAAAESIWLASVAAQVVQSAFRIWASMQATTWVWRREAARLAVVPDALPRLSVEGFFAKQRPWLIGGSIYLAMSVLGLIMMLEGTDPQISRLLADYGIERTTVLVSLVWAIGELFAALWLAFQMKRDSMLPAEAAQ